MAKNPNIKIPEDKYQTNQGKWLLYSITKRYIEFTQKNKRKPHTLHLGKNQSEILHFDAKARDFIENDNGNLSFSERQSEVRFT